MVTVKKRLISVPQNVISTEFPNARISLGEAKMYRYASRDQVFGITNMGRVCSSSSVAKELNMM